jgi:hypothetical protein
VLKLLLILLLTPALSPAAWDAEALVRGLNGFTWGEPVVDAADGGNGSVTTSTDRGSFAFEGKPGRIWRVSHTFFYEDGEAQMKCLMATITVLHNATGVERKVIARALGRALAGAKRSTPKPSSSELGGHKLDVSWAHVTGKKEMLMIFLQAKP